MNASYKKAIITAIKEEVPGIKTYSIIVEGGAPLPYKAGQFITLIFSHHHKEERRSFSITSTPALNEPFSFTVKRLDNGAYSRLLNDRAKEGDTLYTTGSSGLFILPENINSYKQIFFFAAGIGITPIISIIKTLLHTTSQQVVLIYSNRNKEEVVFYEELVALKNKFSNFQLEFLYSSSFNLSRARLSKWLLPTLVAEYAKTETADMLFYICGPFSYMRMAIITLQEMGIDDEQIKRENFNINERPAIKNDPPDKATHNVTITINKTAHTFPVVYPSTILQSAKKQGITLLYSCETGRCGSCAALCTSGKVWMSYNEVLMDSDIKKGMVLTCTGHPVDGDVTLKL